MATYTKLNPKIIQSIADEYELKIIESFPLDGGSGNSSFVLKDDQFSYVLTVCDDKNLKEISKMGALLLFLESHNVPCSRLVLTSNNDRMSTLKISNKIKPVMIKRHIEGHVIKELDETMLFQVGMELARLNNIPSPDYLPRSHPYGLEFFSNVIGLNIDAEYESWLSKEMIYLKRHIIAGLPKGLIHGDLFYDNILFIVNSNSSISFKAFIDFEESCNYYLVFELGMGILGCCIKSNTIDLNKARAFVRGYQQERSLTKEEKESLQLFVHYAAVALSYWRFNKYNIKEPNESMARQHWEMVEVAKNISEVLDTRFYNSIFAKD
ncbi:homoserine kinase [bacterium]|nr:homoserine kinase [bacterium]